MAQLPFGLAIERGHGGARGLRHYNVWSFIYTVYGEKVSVSKKNVFVLKSGGVSS